MVGISVGVLVGGIVADRFFQFNFIATVGYLVASFLMVQVALAWLPFWVVMSGFLIGGFMMGVVFTSRDWMVREASLKV